MTAIDCTTGDLHLDDGTVVSGGQRISELEAAGLHFVRILPMGPGWAMYSTSDVLFASKLAYLSFSAYEGVIASVSFGFAEERGKDDQKKLADYKSILLEWLGPPTTVRPGGLSVSYSYQWGGITAMYDTRGGSCSITVRWAVPFNEAIAKTKEVTARRRQPSQEGPG